MRLVRVVMCTNMIVPLHSSTQLRFDQSESHVSNKMQDVS